MSTYAAVFMKNPNTGLYSGFDVKYDGYIEGGVGEILYKNYNDINKISKLCYDSRSEMRQLEPEVEACDWFSDEAPTRAKKYKNLSFDQMINQGKQCNYCYIYYPDPDDNGTGRYWWFVLDKNSWNEFKSLSVYFDGTENPDTFDGENIVIDEDIDEPTTTIPSTYTFIIEQETYTDNYEEGEGKFINRTQFDSTVKDATSLEDALCKFWEQGLIGNTYDFNADKSGIVLDKDSNKLMYNRTENKFHEIPSESELEQWKAGKIDLYAVYYYIKIFKKVQVLTSELEQLGVDTDD